jgi:hypothetical protein
VGPEFGVKRTSGENRVDYSEIIEDLECARLDALTTRALERGGSCLDQTKRDPTARELEREGQPGWPGSDNKYGGFVHGTKVV